MTHEDPNVNISGISGGDIDIGNIVTGDVGGDVVGRDKILVQIIQQAGLELPRGNLPALAATLKQTLPHLSAANQAITQNAIEQVEQAIADLPGHEQRYRERLKKRFAEDALYYIPLAGETTEAAKVAETDPRAPRSARRRRQRAIAEYHEWIQAGQELKRVKLSTLREGVDKYPCVILLGDPGSGKTTALEHLAYEFADEQVYLPLPLRLSEFGPGLTLEDFIAQGWGGSEQAGYWAAPELVVNLTGYLEQGRLFVLFDALNEMSSEGYKERAQELRRFVDNWSVKGNRFLVTCRVLDYGEELTGLQRVEVQPLNDNQIEAFLRNELPQSCQGLWQRLTEGEAGQRRLLEMARNPYILTMMIDVFDAQGELGRNQAELMTRFTQILLSRDKAKYGPDEWLDVDVQREALSILAFEMQDRPNAGTMVKTYEIENLLPEKIQPGKKLIPSPPMKEVLTLAASANVVEMPVDRSSVRFYHQLLQEYFAAREMLKREPGSLNELWRWPRLEEEMPLWVRPEDNYDPLPPPPPTGWEETTILAAGLAAENDIQLVQALIHVNPVLAGRCLHEGQARVNKATHQAVIDSLLMTISRPEVALRVRIAAGEVLGYLGDPRLGELVAVPAGEFLMGGGNEQHKLFLPEYQIGKYPLTNAEFRRFIEAGGYQEKRWWTEAGWQRKERDNWTEPRRWDDSLYNKPTLPVVGVSWYECVAYCRWLSAKSGRMFRLPTEAEWEKAARGEDGRRYPWGNEFEASWLNAWEGEQQAKTTTPIGIYPAGASPFDVFDCAGNVEEWCATKAPNFNLKSYPYDIKEDEWRQEYLSGTDVRVLRGSTFLDTVYGVLYIRETFPPDERLNSIGFRVVLAPI